MLVAGAMVKCLELEGINVVFGYPGAAICPFYDFLSQSSIRHILVRHEQNAGHAANGYARATNRPGVCIATSGPGATNLITAIATAYADSVPMVIITGQVSTDQIGRDVFQEADITGSVEPFVKHSYLVKDANSLPYIFKEAFYIADSGRKGPVLIDVPVDIQNEEIEFDYPEEISIRAYKPTIKGNALQIKRAVTAIEAAKTPLLCSGGGVFAADASLELHKLAQKADLPVVTTMMGLGTIRGDDERFFGMIGMHGSAVANRAMADCDLIILIGARVGDRAVRSPSFLAETTQIIHIDIDPAEIGKNVHADIPIVGDSKIILNQICEKLHHQTHTEWLEKLNSYKKEDKLNPISYDNGFINPKAFIAKLSDKAPENLIYCADVGQNQIWSSDYFKVKDGRFITSGGMGTMGVSLPFAIGAKLAKPDSPVIAVCGDGGFQMSMMELVVIAEEKIPLKIIMMRNNCLGMVREVQVREYDGRNMAVDLGNKPDFCKIAEAYGIKTMQVFDKKSANEALELICNTSFNEPLFVECMVSKDEKTV